MQRPRSYAAVFVLPMFVACGGEGDTATTLTTSGATAGASGQKGGSSGASGNAGQPSGGAGVGGAASAGAAGVAAKGGGPAAGAAGAAAGQAGTAGIGGSGGTAGQAAGGAGAGGATATPACKCLVGDGPYCGARAKAEADEAGCELAALSGHAGDLLKCENDKWSVLEDCAGACKYTASSTKLDDACELPVCDCFVQVAWCGSGAAKEAAKMGCRIPLLPASAGDILYCPGGKWTVKQDCPLGCVEAPTGTPDACKSASDYRMPFDCGTTRTCTNGNHTSNHDGKDEYAYDFGMPVGTQVRAMRAGTVLATRYVSPPGSACYDGGGSGCANYANTIEIKHSDGTVALYMHLSKLGVAKGDVVQQGDPIGKSGNSGYSTGPHLHVQIQGNCGIWWCQSVPFKFVEDATISQGTSVKSANCP